MAKEGDEKDFSPVEPIAGGQSKGRGRAHDGTDSLSRYTTHEEPPRRNSRSANPVSMADSTDRGTARDAANSLSRYTTHEEGPRRNSRSANPVSMVDSRDRGTAHGATNSLSRHTTYEEGPRRNSRSANPVSIANSTDRGRVHGGTDSMSRYTTYEEGPRRNSRSANPVSMDKSTDRGRVHSGTDSMSRYTTYEEAPRRNSRSANPASMAKSTDRGRVHGATDSMSRYTTYEEGPKQNLHSPDPVPTDRSTYRGRLRSTGSFSRYSTHEEDQAENWDSIGSMLMADCTLRDDIGQPIANLPAGEGADHDEEYDFDISEPTPPVESSDRDISISSCDTLTEEKKADLDNTNCIDISKPIAEAPALDRADSSASTSSNATLKNTISRRKTRASIANDQTFGYGMRIYNSSVARTRSSTASKKPKPWYKKLNPLKDSKPPPYPEERVLSREYGAGFWSMLTFRWISPLMRVGYQRRLEMVDVWLVNPERSADLLISKVKVSFAKRMARGDKYPLFWAIHETFKREFWIGGICQLFANIFTVISPYTLRYLITFAAESYIATKEGTPGPPIGRGVGLVIGITIMQVLQSLGTNHFLYHGMMVGGQSRTVLIGLLFEKSMKISGRAKAGGRALTRSEEEKISHGEKPGPGSHPGISGDGRGWGNGRVINMMSVDTFRIDQASGMFHMIWTAPLASIITLIVLCLNLGFSALAGFGLLVIGVPVLTKAVKNMFVRRKGINKITDQRVTLTHEILTAVRFVKYFGWEGAFMKQINAIRARETRSIQFFLAIRNIIASVSISLPIFASLVSFVTYSMTGHELVAAKVFSSVALFNALRMPLNLLPVILGQAADAWASLERIQDYLLAEEVENQEGFIYQARDAVNIWNADFSWERHVTVESDKTKAQIKHEVKASKVEAKLKAKMPSSGDEKASGRAGNETEEKTPFQIHGVDFNLRRNELVAVIGGVGSGKTSLLAALAGDMRRTKGYVVWGASRAFCPQYAWIQNATVRENILFGKPYNRAWYRKVIDACSLTTDFDMLPNGDSTEIGERGINVSGGQKQRLNIARAIYHDADVVLMDDPLSAVDAHVGRHIFDNAICGLLKGKCRVLATHQLQVLHRCDRIIWMEDGRIRAMDTYDRLMRKDEAFAKMMAMTATEPEEEPDKNTEEEERNEIERQVTLKKGPGLIQAEERGVESIPWSLYTSYIRASGTILNGPIVLLLLLASQGANIVTSLWLSWWVSNKFGFKSGVYIGVYATLGVAQALLTYLFSIYLAMMGTTSSKVMLDQAMRRVLRAPMSFFDTTPLGRITNRFSKDVDTMDFTLTDALRLYFLTMAMILSIFTLVIVYFHYFAIALGPLIIMFLLSASYYRASAREMKRSESILRSVVFARFSEALSGTSSIRAYGLQDRFVKKLTETIDDMNSAYFLTFANQRWLSVRLDLIGNTLIFITGMLVVTSRFNVSPSISGLILSYILGIVQMIQYIVRQFADVENAMISTERLNYYGRELEEEAPLHLIPVEPSWPKYGEITFTDVEMRYRDGLPLVLKGLTMHIAGGERIGVVGRTGAGKSSIMSTLFRLVEISNGSIEIDGQDISRVGLQDLRSRLAIIPQDPNLFRGTIRSNLDPFGDHTDLELWSALRLSDLVSPDASAPEPHAGHVRLDDVVEEEGLNYSLGQRQLLAMARALVRGARIIICDEATSSVDLETDMRIQKTMQEGFQGKTLLCIAHRLRTIIHYDRICVMDQGCIAELDKPKVLFEQGGIFRGMCEENGIRAEDFDS